TILFPFWAILTAHYLAQVARAVEVRWLTVLRSWTIRLVVVLILLVHVVCRPAPIPWWAWLLVSSLLGLCLSCGWRLPAAAPPRLVAQLALVTMALNGYLLLGLAPTLFTYQAGSEAAWYSNRYYPGVPVVQVAPYVSAPLTFYLDQPLRIVPHATETTTVRQRPYLLYAPVEELQGIPGQLVHTFASFPISRLTLPFLYYK